MSDPSNDIPPATPYEPQGPYAAEPLGYQTPAVRHKPTSVMVLGIIGIVFGAYGTLCAPVQVLGAILNSSGALAPRLAATMPTTMATTTPAAAFAMAQPSTAMNVWTLVSAIVAVPLALALLAGGIGSVMFKPWARRLMLAYAILSIVIGILSLVVNILIVLPETNRQFQAVGLPPYSNWLMMLGMVLVSLLGLVYPAFVLFYYRKQHVIDAFEGSRIL